MAAVYSRSASAFWLAASAASPRMRCASAFSRIRLRRLARVERGRLGIARRERLVRRLEQRRGRPRRAGRSRGRGRLGRRPGPAPDRDGADEPLLELRGLAAIRVRIRGLAELVVGLRHQAVDLGVGRARGALQVEERVLGLAVGELGLRGALQLVDVDRRYVRARDLVSHGGRQVREVRAVEVRDDLEIGTGGDRGLQLLPGALRVPGDVVGPGALEMQVRLAVRGHARPTPRPSRTSRRLPEPARVEGLLGVGLECARPARARAWRRGGGRSGESEAAHQLPPEAGCGGGAVHVFVAPSSIETLLGHGAQALPRERDGVGAGSERKPRRRGRRAAELAVHEDVRARPLRRLDDEHRDAGTGNESGPPTSGRP